MRGSGQMAYHDGRECRHIDIPGLFPPLPMPRENK
jgi:hypothetical protein